MSLLFVILITTACLINHLNSITMLQAKQSDFSYNILPDDLPTESKFYQPHPFEDLLFTTDENGVSELHSDVYLLMNAERLSQSIDKDTLDYWLRGLPVDHAKDLQGNFDDVQLISYIKDKNIQSPSELKLYMDYLSDKEGGIASALESYKQGVQVHKDYLDQIKDNPNH